MCFLLIGTGSATAFHFLKGETKSDSLPNYEKPNAAQAASREQKAKSRVQEDQEALAAAKQAVKSAEAEWQSAQETLEEARQSAADNAVEAAEETLAQAGKALEAAKTELKAAEDKLKTADQKLAEAEAERQRVAEQVALQDKYRKALLGHWTKIEDYGPTQLELREDGTGTMFIQFEGIARYIVGDSLDIDIEWEVSGDRVVFNSVAGRPAAAYNNVTVLQGKGTRRDYVITHADENSFETYDVGNKTKVKKWTRVEKPDVKLTKMKD